MLFFIKTGSVNRWAANQQRNLFLFFHTTEAELAGRLTWRCLNQRLLLLFQQPPLPCFRRQSQRSAQAAHSSYICASALQPSSQRFPEVCRGFGLFNQNVTFMLNHCRVQIINRQRGWMSPRYAWQVVAKVVSAAHPQMKTGQPKHRYGPDHLPQHYACKYNKTGIHRDFDHPAKCHILANSGDLFVSSSSTVRPVPESQQPSARPDHLPH